MIEIYPEKQKGLRIMFFVICFLCMIQFFLLAWMSGKLEFFELHIYDQNKRILDIENRLHLEGGKSERP